MRTVSILLLLLISIIRANAQTFFSTTEFGFSLGGSQYFGDLNDNYGFKTIHPAGGVYTRLHLNPYISLRGSLNYTMVSYDDKLSSDPYDKERNLNFKSNIIEGVAQAEFNFFRFSTGDKYHRFTPYLTGGIGVFYYNPYTYYDGKKYNLRDEGTEGQNAGLGHRYSNIAVCFPIGVGVKYWVKPGMNLGFEITDRLTTTDYLDDVSTTYAGSDKFPNNNPKYPNPAYVLQDRSIELEPNTPLGRAGKQRGNSSTKDQYLTFVVTCSFQLKVYRCPGYLKHGFTDY